ncbi:Choline-sulfatase [Planctomycetes bacterium Pla163]|uniref:Choline-sulfatase n=1 Tax=Rohdeia mirabilis TaxID=2528008 RepID=A0A518D3B9_9BACT|nr:Choline-sulfatase [Planctomycetes bacterium Pla163]
MHPAHSSTPRTRRRAGGSPRQRPRLVGWPVAAVLVAFGASTLLSRPAPSTTTPLPPDLVVVVADDLGWEDLLAVHTPNIDALASGARLFSRHYVDPAGAPTRFALHFGAYGARVGLGDELGPSDSSPGTARISVCEALRLSDYASSSFGPWALTSDADALPLEGPRLHGFEHVLAGSSIGIDAANGETQTNWEQIDDGRATPSTRYTSDVIANAFEFRWSQTASSTRPRLAFVNFTTPAAPFTAPPANLLPGGYPTPTTDRERLEASVVALDAAIGRVLAAVDLAHTVVVLTSDGGTSSLAPPPSAWFQGYGGTAFEGGVRVPLIVAGAGVVPGWTHRPTHAVDIAVTLLALGGRPLPPVGFEDGVAFAAELTGGTSARPPVVSLAFTPNGPGAPLEQRWCVADALGNKLVFDGVQERLFDLQSDPFEFAPTIVTGPGANAIADGLRAFKTGLLP